MRRHMDRVEREDKASLGRSRVLDRVQGHGGGSGVLATEGHEGDEDGDQLASAISGLSRDLAREAARVAAATAGTGARITAKKQGSDTPGGSFRPIAHGERRPPAYDADLRRVIGPTPVLGPDDRDGAQSYLSRILHALDMQSAEQGFSRWSSSQYKRLIEMRGKWQKRADGKDPAFMAHGTRFGAVSEEVKAANPLYYTLTALEGIAEEIKKSDERGKRMDTKYGYDVMDLNQEA